jgi:hypothetical protein
MLADELANNTVLPQLCLGVSEIQKKILVAQKFSLAPDFALAADGMVENIPELTKIGPFCRIPYPLSWFELAHSDRKNWSQAPMHFPGEQHRPDRIGFLCEALNKELSSWKTILCWSIKKFEFCPFTISELAVNYDTGNGGTKLEDWVDIDYSGISRLGAAFLTEKHMQDLIRSDWAGEIRYLFAVLGLLNARNVAETKPIEYNKLNKHRVKKKLFILSSHTLLKIRAQHKQALTGHAGATGTSEIRAHFVRGHWKVRRTGHYFWGPHMRGRLAHGYVHKDYQLEE